MGSVGANNSIFTKINTINFVESQTAYNTPIFTADIPGVGKGAYWQNTQNTRWDIVIGKYVNGTKLELVDTPNPVSSSATRQGAETLVRNWLRAIANGDV